MKHAETVIFGGGGLDRAVELRGKSHASDAADARAILQWRGKPLVRAGLFDRLILLPLDHPVIKGRPMSLLGREAGRLIYGVDISDWQPEGLDPAALTAFFDQSEQAHPDLPLETCFADLRRIMTLLNRREAELAASAKALKFWQDGHEYCGRCGSRSEIVMSGWQRSCPTCKAQQFPRTDPVVIMLITRGNQVLLGRSHIWPKGMYSLLAGFIEPGETIEAAVRREVREETGITVGHVDYMASQPWAFPGSLMIGCRGEATSREIVIDHDELEDALWLSREDMLDVFAGRNPELFAARKGSIAHFLLHTWLADRAG